MFTWADKYITETCFRHFPSTALHKSYHRQVSNATSQILLCYCTFTVQQENEILTNGSLWINRLSIPPRSMMCPRTVGFLFSALPPPASPFPFPLPASIQWLWTQSHNFGALLMMFCRRRRVPYSAADFDQTSRRRPFRQATDSITGLPWK